MKGAASSAVAMALVVGVGAAGVGAADGAAAAESSWYLRADLSHDWSRPAAFHDRGDCAGTDPARVPLYGCAARGAGDFGGSAGFGAGVGYRVHPLLRLDATLTYRPGWRFAGQANFLPADNEPMSARARTLTGMANAYLDLPGLGRFEPYLGAGAGVSHNRLDGVRLHFPSLDQRVWTPSGRTTSFAWQLTAGTGVALGDGLTLDVAYRFTDFGTLRTDAGDAPRLRRGAWRTLTIDGTEARLRAHGVSLGLRYGF